MKTYAKLSSLWLIVSLLAAWAALPSAQPARAAGVIVVNSNVDDGTLVLIANNTCDLREAIENANNDDQAFDDCTAGSGTDTISFAGNYTVTLYDQLPLVTSNIIINGKGVANTIIQANANDGTATYRIFAVGEDATDILTLNNLTIRHGRCNGTCETSVDSGGAVYVGNLGTLNLINTMALNNYTSSKGGAILSNGTVNITNSTLFGNVSSSGAGIELLAGSALNIKNSSILSNTATNDGGGIWAALGATTAITNSTLAANSAGDEGGGILNGGNVTITNSTIAENSSVTSGSGILNTGVVTLKNTIVASNTGSQNCNNILGILTADSFNIDTDGSCDNASIKTALELNLDILNDYGGPTKTFSLKTGSHAIDAGNVAVCATAPVNSLDQRGVYRPQGTACDVGAYEFDVMPTVTSITRVNASPTAKASVKFTVTFSEPVTGVSAADFSLTPTGITSASVIAVTGTGKTRVVTVNTGSGSGTLRLNIPGTATITDLLTGNSLANTPFTSGAVYTINKKLTYTSAGGQDGWMLESTETSNLGGTLDIGTDTFRVGDDAADKQYRSILSFNTGGIPNNATITKATLKIKRPATGFLIGNNDPFSWGLGLKVDVCEGFFGTTSGLQLADFNFNNAINCAVPATTFSSTPTANWYSANILGTAFAKINLVGLTQFRLRFAKDDNDDGLADYLKFISGDTLTVANRPQLIIQYYLP